MRNAELYREALHCLAVAEDEAHTIVRERLAAGHPDALVPLANRAWIPQRAMDLMEGRSAGWLLAASEDECERRQARIYRQVCLAADEQSNWQTLEEQPQP
ncbi:hypothetical protein IRY44_07650 [Micromonospora sp. ANENR4]|uniref:hypothetical protein n=1 Tax=Micromonospora sp. ANENR4 TaxID=2783662 RepID=UPI0018905C67|nr:hypothetical protein [Micromonospora sp. ANENR4]MBF5029611.1 hypothetical protein [Micromonospora sp. ANENR4]